MADLKSLVPVDTSTNLVKGVEYIEVNEISAPSTPPSGKLRVYAKTDSKLYTKNDGGIEIPVGPASYVCVRDEKTQNTPGGTFTSGAWRTRDINTELSDEDNICSVTGNQITLAAGSYICDIKCIGYYCDRHQARLYNVTDSALVVLGTVALSYVAGFGHTSSVIRNRFTIGSSKALEIQHRCQTTSVTYGFGVEANFTTEVYTVAEFWKVA